MERVSAVYLPDPTGGPSVQCDLFSRPNKADPAQVSLIYGPNGAGKSTLARSIHEALKHRASVEGGVDDDLQVASAPPMLFNEGFIEEIGYSQDHTSRGRVKTILLLGEQKTTRDRLDAISAELCSLESQLEQHRARLSEVQDEGGEIDTTRAAIVELLRKRGGWSDQHIEAHGMKRAPAIKDALLDKMIAVVEGRDEIGSDGLQEILEEKVKLLSAIKATSDRQQVHADIPTYKIPWRLERVKTLLAQRPELKVASDLEEHFAILSSSTDGHSAISAAEIAFLDRAEEVCPTCAQTVSAEWRQRLQMALQDILHNDEREGLIGELKRLGTLHDRLPAQLDSEVKRVVGQKVAQAYENDRAALEEPLRALQSKVELKIQQPESVQELDLEGFETVFAAYDSARERCADAVRDFNADVEERDNLIARFDQLNLATAAADLELNNELRDLSSLRDEQRRLKEAAEKCEAEINRLTGVKTDLQAQDLNFKDAIDLMNRYLAVVFADDHRLELVPQDMGYEVKVRGTSVSLQQLSTGERNIIALVYYFANIFNGSNDHKLHREKRFLILDDPISSFDRENRFGVLLLLQQLFSRFLNGNPATQIVIFSHDLAVIQDLAESFKTINSVTVTLRRIDDHCLRELRLDSYSNYDSLLKKIYRFASADEESLSEIDDVPTGNEMRLVLEAFGVFLLSAGISQLPEAQVVKALFEQKDLPIKPYFEGRLYKLLLHGESHSANAIRAGHYDLSPAANLQERQLVARDLIVLMSIIAPNHVPAKLGMKTVSTSNEDPNNLPGFTKLREAWIALINKRSL